MYFGIGRIPENSFWLSSYIILKICAKYEYIGIITKKNSKDPTLKVPGTNENEILIHAKNA